MGDTWVAQKAFIDGMLRPIEAALVDRISTMNPRDVLDVGCGTGATTAAIARRLGEDGSCVGIDLSEAMIRHARAINGSDAQRAKFIAADASSYRFDKHQFDLVCSRFGVMFFGDPINAFSNLRSAVKEEARLLLTVWRAPEPEDFMWAGKQAIARIVPESDPPPPHAPGPFSFGDATRVRKILESSGWDELTFFPRDFACRFAASDLDLFIEKLAPLGVDLESLDQRTAKQVREAAHQAYQPFVDESVVRFTAPVWIIEGRASTVQ
ncbi:MAG: class I SAM-dependent methyltransferase [Pseudomonadota bacterium]